MQFQYKWQKLPTVRVRAYLAYPLQFTSQDYLS